MPDGEQLERGMISKKENKEVERIQDSLERRPGYLHESQYNLN